MSKRIVLLQALAATPNDLSHLLAGLESAAMDRPALSSKWSEAALLGHLWHVEKRYLHRLQQVEAEDEPYIPAIHPEIDESAAGRTLSKLLALFAAERKRTIDYLTGLPPAAWQRGAVHENWGKIKFRYLVQHLVDHDTEHLSQLVELRARAGQKGSV